MRSFPPFQLFLVILGFSLLAFPLYQLTGGMTSSHPDTATAHKTTEQAAQIKATIRVRCAHAPQKLELFTPKGTLVLWEKENTWPQTVEVQTDPALPLEVAISAIWPKEVASTAVTMEYIPENRSSEIQTLWSIDSEMEDVFLFNTNKPKP